MSRILVLGAGMMGAAITVPAADNAHSIVLVGTQYDADAIRSISESGWHPGLETQLSSYVEPFDLDFCGQNRTGPSENGREEAQNAKPDLIISAVTSAALPWACYWITQAFSDPVPVVLVAKGVSMHGSDLMPLSDFAAAELKRRSGKNYPVVAIAGPCIARDLANKHHTSVVLASRDLEAAKLVKRLLGTSYYHLQIEPDVDGAEFCAAFKNLYAIAVGWGAGTGARSSSTKGGVPTVNLKATLFAQALLEIGYLVEIFGGVDKTALGPAGAGDLYVTCDAGRNGRLGKHMGTGLSFRDVIAGPMRGETVEGAELGHLVEPHIKSMIASGKIASDRIPFLLAILHEICVGPHETFDFAEILGIQNNLT